MLLLAIACFQESDSFSLATNEIQATDICGDTPSGSVMFPNDVAGHSELNERWRWQARLDDGKKEYFSQVEATWLSNTTWQVYQSLAIPETGAFISSVNYFSGPAPGSSGLDLSLLGLTATGGQGNDSVLVETDDWNIFLDFSRGKAPMLFNGTGDMTFEEGMARGYTWTRMNVAASLVMADNTQGTPIELSGRGSMEHSWGDFSAVEASGWVRFALQLDDGRDLSIVYVPDQQNTVASATLSDSLCWVSDVSQHVTVTPGSSWTSTGSACSWPTSWTIKVGEDSFELSAPMSNQEVSSADMQVWSGEVNVEGQGRGSVVATGCF